MRGGVVGRVEAAGDCSACTTAVGSVSRGGRDSAAKSRLTGGGWLGKLPIRAGPLYDTQVLVVGDNIRLTEHAHAFNTRGLLPCVGLIPPLRTT